MDRSKAFQLADKCESTLRDMKLGLTMNQSEASIIDLFHALHEQFYDLAEAIES